MKRRPHFYIVALIISFFTSLALADEQKMNILEVYDQFVMANKATNLCSKPTEVQTKNHFKNTLLVTMKAMQKVKELKPSYSREQIIDVMKKRSDMLSQKINTKVESDGCNNPVIQDLIKRHEIQSNLKLG